MRWTVDEFHEINSLLAFGSMKLVPLAGEILKMPEPGAPRDAGLGFAVAGLKAASRPGSRTRGRMAPRLSR